MELANAFEPVQDGRIYIGKINGPLLHQLKGTPTEYRAGLDRAIAKGWLVMLESGTYVRFTEAGAAPFAWSSMTQMGATSLLAQSHLFARAAFDPSRHFAALRSLVAGTGRE